MKSGLPLLGNPIAGCRQFGLLPALQGDTLPPRSCLSTWAIGIDHGFRMVAIWVNPDVHLDLHFQAKLKFTVPLAWNKEAAIISRLVRFIFGKTEMLIFD